MNAPAPYPLLFEPVLMEKVWGGRRLAGLGKRLARADAKYGESWELADLGATSASGAGGAGVRSVIANGALAGKTIHEAIGVWGESLLPRAALSRDGAFPLLVKYLDAAEDLSVQVHPSAEYAAAHPARPAHVKSECWYVMEAEPPPHGAKIYKGVREGVSREEFARLARAGEARIVEAMEAVPAVVGECHDLPSGTVHALGAGVMVAEVQTPSDTTFRLYDWGRTGREMHVEEALECAAMGPAPEAVRFDKPGSFGGVLATPWFSIMMFRVDERGLPLGMAAGRVLMVVGGEVEMEGAGNEVMRVTRGGTVFVPRGLGNGWTIRGVGREAEVLSVSIAERGA